MRQSSTDLLEMVIPTLRQSADSRTALPHFQITQPFNHGSQTARHQFHRETFELFQGIEA